jgi:methyltransferase-like protein
MLVYSSSSDKSADKQDLLDRKKQKFLDSINFDGDNIKTSSKIAPILREIKENFPNLSDETLEKLSTKEGLENRKEILESLSEKEIEPLTKLINKGKSLTTFEDLKDEYKKELEKESLNHTLELQQL